MRRILVMFLLMPICLGPLLSCQPKPATQKQALVVPTNPDINESMGKLFLARNKLATSVYSLQDGLQFSIVKDGSGVKPKLNDLVTVYYQGRYTDGSIFDKEHAQSNPITIRVSSLIPGWQQGIQMMSPGAVWILYIPPNLAYGEKGIPGMVGPNQTLIYYIHLLHVQAQ